MKKAIIIALCILMFACTFRLDAHALTVMLNPWEVVFEDYNRVFIMTPPFMFSTEFSTWDIEHGRLEWTMQQGLSVEERMQIRSGLYYNVYPLINIYYVDTFFTPRPLYFSSDGIYFVQLSTVINRSPYGLDMYVTRFFANGSLINGHQLRDVILFRLILFSSQAVFWMDHSSVILDQQTNVLTLTTIEGNTITFDITTGEIISFQINPAIFIIIGLIVLLIITIIIIVVMNKRRNRKMIMDSMRQCNKDAG